MVGPRLRQESDVQKHNLGGGIQGLVEETAAFCLSSHMLGEQLVEFRNVSGLLRRLFGEHPSQGTDVLRQQSRSPVDLRWR